MDPNYRPPLGVPGQQINGTGVAHAAPQGIPQPEGPFYPTQEPDGFTAGSFWDASYNFKPVGIDAQGEIPIPSQAKIDNYNRKTMLLDFQRQRVAREVGRPFEQLLEQAQDAQRTLDKALQAGDDNAIAAWRSELRRLEGEINLTEEMLTETQKQKDELLSSYKDAVANLCSNKPTRKQLEKLSEPDLYGFMNYLGRKLAPEA
jgi:hypothetical protein